jgi:hypothetical protein
MWDVFSFRDKYQNGLLLFDIKTYLAHRDVQ